MGKGKGKCKAIGKAETNRKGKGEGDETSAMSTQLIVAREPTAQFGVMKRQQLMVCLMTRDFGSYLSRNADRAAIFDRAAAVALSYEKHTDVRSTRWRVQGQQWLHLPIDLRPLSERASLECLPDVYSYGEAETPAGTLVVDFANKRVGGGCFGRGFVQEEQMVAQSTDFAMRLCCHRDLLQSRDAISYEGVHIDLWWPRSETAKKENLNLQSVSPCCSQPLTILAVDAPKMPKKFGWSYSKPELDMLTQKVLLIFEAAKALGSPLVLSGLLGGGAYRGNRPLVLALHLLLQPPDEVLRLRFHYPVFRSFNTLDTSTLEQRVLEVANELLGSLRKRGVTSLGEVLHVLHSWRLPLSQGDADLDFEIQSGLGDPTPPPGGWEIEEIEDFESSIDESANSSLSSMQCVMALPAEILECALKFACVTLKGIGACSSVCRDWSNASKVVAPTVFLRAPLDVEALMEKLQYQPNAVKVDRIIRNAARDMLIMDVREFRKIVQLQVLFQHFRKSNDELTLRYLVHKLAESVGCPKTANGDDLLVSAMGMLKISDLTLSENIAGAIPRMQIMWRRTNLSDYCCIASVLQVLLQARFGDLYHLCGAAPLSSFLSDILRAAVSA